MELSMPATAAIAVAACLVLAYASASSTTPPVPANTRMCAAYGGVPPQFGTSRQSGMARVPAGSFEPGSNAGYPDERSAGPVRVKAFWIDRTEVSNAQFSAFVLATNYVTHAEREGASAVFQAPAPGHGTKRQNEWWVWTRGANWRHPEGPVSGIQGRENQPVVHVTFSDAMAYARWLGHDLPTEAEWEFAARANGDGELLEREPRDPSGRTAANYWQGVFPDLNTKEDGYAALAPSGCYAPNGFGLYDMIGNVWELTRDHYTGPRQPHSNGDPEDATGIDPTTMRNGGRFVIKGGSFLCSADYCVRYRASAREAQGANVAASHVGFRTVLRE